MTGKLTRADLEAARLAVAAMAGKTEGAKRKFAPGTSQHTLQANRLRALKIASSLISRELAASEAVDYSKEDLEKALAPLASLMSKSEKARQKLAPGSWHHTMLGKNLKALRIAAPLLAKALREKRLKRRGRPPLPVPPPAEKG